MALAVHALLFKLFETFQGFNAQYDLERTSHSFSLLKILRKDWLRLRRYCWSRAKSIYVLDLDYVIPHGSKAEPYRKHQVIVQKRFSNHVLILLVFVLTACNGCSQNCNFVKESHSSSPINVLLIPGKFRKDWKNIYHQRDWVKNSNLKRE